MTVLHPQSDYASSSLNSSCLVPAGQHYILERHRRVHPVGVRRHLPGYYKPIQQEGRTSSKLLASDMTVYVETWGQTRQLACVWVCFLYI